MNIVIVAGPQGSGKTTYVRNNFQCRAYVDKYDIQDFGSSTKTVCYQDIRSLASILEIRKLAKKFPELQFVIELQIENFEALKDYLLREFPGFTLVIMNGFEPTIIHHNDIVNSPSHYTDGKIEVIDYIEDKKLNFNLGNTIKYISRAGKKGDRKEDLEKALWYLKRELGLPKEKNISLSVAIETLKRTLKNDEDYFDGWAANIAMSFIDEFYKVPKETALITRDKIHDIANTAAENFLNNLIK